MVSTRRASALVVMIASAATMSMLSPGVSGEIQAYFKACRGNWEFQSKFRYPEMTQLFVAKPSEFTVIDCAIRCSAYFNNQIGDYIFIGPADFGQNPSTKDKAGCHCIAKDEPNWVFNLENIPGMNDNGCVDMRCADGQMCGAVDKWGVHYASYLIDNPSPDKPIQQLSPAAVEKGTYSGTCGGKKMLY
ncbi:hypothetical protein HDU67_007875 [Dinochytrium kinnereticum]|nr:hypothetical protein HDU67_007875 [Dinochytrium kinnereticum]